MKSNNKFILGMLVVPLALVGIGVTYASSVATPNTFVGGTMAVASQVNANFAAHAAAINDNDARLDSHDGAPAFSAYANSLGLHNVGDNVICNQETLDEGGNGYNPANGSYTVQRSGLYLLTFSTNFISSGAIAIKKSGGSNLAAVWDYHPDVDADETSASTTIVVRLTAGEIVWPEVTFGTSVELWASNVNGRYTTFSGCWLRP